MAMGSVGGQLELTTSESAGIALLATRVASIVRRYAAGEKLDRTDKVALREAREFVKTLDTTLDGTPSRQLTSVGLGIRATPRGSRGSEAKLNEWLEQVGAELDAIERKGELHNSDAVVDYFRRLAQDARHLAGQPGDTVVRSIL